MKAKDPLAPPKIAAAPKRRRGSGKKKPASDQVSGEQFAVFAETCRRHYVDVKQPIVLISQVERSGGPLLRHLFDNHPELHVHPYELQIGFPNRVSWPRLRLEYPPELWWNRLREESLEALWRRGMRHHRPSMTGEVGTTREGVYPFHLVPIVQRWLFLDAVDRADEIAGDRDILDAYLTSLFSAWLDNRNREGNKRWVVASAPRLAWGGGLDAFFTAYPDGRLISILRDPWSWFASGRGPMGKEVGDEDRLIRAWRASANEMIRAKASYPDQVCLLQFDDLVVETERTIRALAAELEIAWSDELVVPTFNGWPIRPRSDYSAQTTTVGTEPLEQARQDLNSQEIEMISEACEELYARVRAVVTAAAPS